MWIERCAKLKGAGRGTGDRLWSRARLQRGSWTWGWAVLLALLLLSWGCGRSLKVKEQKPIKNPEQVEGGRKTSPSRRAADEMPKPWPEERRSFDSDRTGVDPYRTRKQVEEQQKKEE
jgi:hypothetical protein